MILDTLFKTPIEVRVDAVWTDITLGQARNGEVDTIIRPEYVGKVVGVVGMHKAGIPHYIVVDESGVFRIEESHRVTATNYDEIK